MKAILLILKREKVNVYPFATSWDAIGDWFELRDIFIGIILAIINAE